MSDLLTLNTMEFKDDSGKINYGFEIKDNYDTFSKNFFESTPNDDLDLLKKVVDKYRPKFIGCSLSTIGNMLVFIEEIQGNMMINGNLYTWKDIRDIFEL